MSIYEIPLKTIDEAETTLAEHTGKTLLIVNVASECGYTPQYQGLEQLHKKYAAKGFVVLGFPSNDFGAQEPGSNAAIKSFCSAKFNVTFPLFAKIPVSGENKHPLYSFLTGSAPTTGEVQWNFEKFLISAQGTVSGRFLSDVTPESPELAAEIERLLG